MCDKVVFKKPKMIKYCPCRCETQKMCDKAVDACLSALKFVPDWFVTSKMLEILDNVVLSNDDIDLDYTDSDVVTFCSDGMDINTIDLNNITLDNNNDDEEHLGTMIRARLILWCNE